MLLVSRATLPPFYTSLTCTRKWAYFDIKDCWTSSVDVRRSGFLPDYLNNARDSGWAYHKDQRHHDDMKTVLDPEYEFNNLATSPIPWNMLKGTEGSEWGRERQGKAGNLGPAAGGKLTEGWQTATLRDSNPIASKHPIGGSILCPIRASWNPSLSPDASDDFLSPARDRGFLSTKSAFIMAVPQYRVYCETLLTKIMMKVSLSVHHRPSLCPWNNSSKISVTCAPNIFHYFKINRIFVILETAPWA